MRSPLSPDEYGRLLALRTGLRRFEHWSGQQAQAAGLTAAHHQLLLAIQGHDGPEGPTVGEVADYLMLRHHSTVGLVDRAEAAGLVRRERSRDDHRVVRLFLTDEGAARLEGLSLLHIEELERLAVDVPRAWAGLTPLHQPHGGPSSTSPSNVELASVYDDPTPGPTRVLVDRQWPRGVPRRTAPVEEWCRDIAPSARLRNWYRYLPARFEEFADRYREELALSPAREALEDLRITASSKPVVLVTATKDVDRSGAKVLKEVLAEN